jgi:hypothetical protein
MSEKSLQTFIRQKTNSHTFANITGTERKETASERKIFKEKENVKKKMKKSNQVPYLKRLREFNERHKTDVGS